MTRRVFRGAAIFDAGGATQDGHRPVPGGPVFSSPEWKALFRHALDEAAKHGLEISLNIQSGWNLGGPMVKVEDSTKKIVWSTKIDAIKGYNQFRWDLITKRVQSDLPYFIHYDEFIEPGDYKVELGIAGDTYVSNLTVHEAQTYTED